MSSASEQEFIKLFNSVARHQHRYQVFRDFVTMSAITLHNAVAKNETLEAEYMQIVGKYSKEEVTHLAQLLGCLVELLEPKPADILGQLYMSLDLGNTHVGQFFTPASVSEMMAHVMHGETLTSIDKPFITLSEPACGAGGMVLAFVKVMLDKGHNPADKLWVQCTDLDRTAALMCYLQLSLWNVPAQIIVGNTLTLEYREQYFTPAHYLFDWDEKLRCQRMIDYVLELEQTPKNGTTSVKQSNATENQPEPKIKLSPDGGQLDLF